MEDRSKHIDDLFREGLGDHQETPPSSVWESLEQRLPAAEPPVAELPSRRWLWYLLLLLLLATGGYFIYTRVSEDSTTIRQSGQEHSISPATPATDGAVTTTETEGAEGSENAGAARGDAGANTAGGAEATASNENHPANQDNGEANTGDYNEATSGNIPGTNRGRASNSQGNRSGSTTASQGQDKNISSTSGTTSTGSRQAPATNESAASKTNTATTAAGRNNQNGQAPGTSSTNQKSGTTAAERNIDNSPAGSTSSNTAAATTASANSRQNTPTTNTNNQTPSITANKATANTTTGNPATGQPINTRPSTAQGKPVTTTPVNSKGQPVNVQPATAKGKPVTTDPATAKGTPLTTNPSNSEGQPINTTAAKNTAKAPVTTPESGTPKPSEVTNVYSKNNVIGTGRNKTSTPAPSKAPAANSKKTPDFKKTKDGYQILIPEEEEEEETAAIPPPEAEPEEVELEEIAETKEEEVEVEMPKLATGTNPNPTSAGGGGGAAPEPRVALRNFNKIHLEGGIKAGYEWGTSKLSTSGPVIAPYLQWNISPKVAFVLMPSFRYNKVNMLELFAQQAYHRITSQVFDSAHVVTNDTFQGPMIQRNYIYKHTYDSILAGYKVNEQKFWEIDLPLLLKYRLSPKLSLLAGPYLTFGNHIKIEGDIKEFNGLVREGKQPYPNIPDSSNIPGAPSQYPYPPDIQTFFSYNTPEYTGTANQTNFQNPASNPARFGLMFGLSFELGKRILIDMLVRQNLSDLKYIPNDQVRKAYSTPYIRTTVGVKLFNTEKDKPRNPNGL